MATDRDAQRRELEEIRRKFTEMGARVGSLFEPAPEEDPAPDAHPTTPALPPPPPPPPPAPMAVPLPVPVAGAGAGGLSRVVVAGAVAVALLAGVGLGYALPRASAQRAAAVPRPPPGTQAPTASTVAVQPRTVTSVPPSCLETARKGDLTIHLYTINVRDRRLVEALKAYTLASQACRREASP
jgi:hypothetical protein